MHSSGNENHGVHVCNRCGWPFPKPHPSSRHRRAHKRICGTIQGYKLIHSDNPTLSDDDHHSDEDHKTPSPKAMDRTGSDKRRSGIGEKSNRSEDEVFSDAVTEFPDGGFTPGTEEKLMGARAAVTRVASVNETELSTFYSFKDIEFADIIATANNLTDNSQMQNSEISRSPSNLSGSNMESQVPVSTPPEQPSTIAILGDDKQDSSSETHPIEAETPTCASVENKVINVGNEATEGLMTHAEEVNYAKGSDEVTLATNAVAPPTEFMGQTDGAVCKSQETSEMMGDHMIANGVPSMEHHGSAASKVCMDDAAVGHMNYDDNDKIKVVAENESDMTGSVNFNEGYSGKGEEKEDVSNIPVASDISVANHAEITLEDFKDQKGVKLDKPLPSTSSEIDNKEDVEELFSIKNFTNFRPTQPCEATAMPASVLNTPEKNVTHDGSRSVVNDLNTERESDVHQIKFTGNQGSDAQLDDALTVEMKRGHQTTSLEHQQPCDIHNESSDTGFPENAVKVLNDVNPKLSSGKGGNDVVMHNVAEDTSALTMQDAAKDASTMAVHNADMVTNLAVRGTAKDTTSVGDDAKDADAVAFHKAGNDVINEAGNDEKTKDAMCNLDEMRSDDERVKEENCTKNVFTTSESATDPTISLNGSNDTGDYGTGKLENFDVLEVEAKVEETHATKKAETAVKSSSTSQESQLVTEDVVDASATRLPEIESTNIGRVSITEDGIDQLRITGTERSQRVSISEHGEANKPVEEEHSETVPLVSSLDTKPSVQGVVDCHTNHAEEFTKENYDNKESRREENNKNDFAKQQLGASAVDTSADSLSHTDSLENNWGSVSVLSMQSDTPTVVDTQTSSSTHLPASEAAQETNSQKSKVVTEGQQQEKSDVFEAPSFMTLVEAGSDRDRVSSTSDIKSQLKTQQQNTAPLQAGWFPSLTHVVNESQGRKKNEEIIEKVTNWSAGKQHTPLKNLLGEAKSPNHKDSQASVVGKDKSNVVKDNSSAPTTVSSILAPEGEAGKEEMEKDWNSPARYPADIKRVKRRPFWVQFVCCSSMN